MCSANRVQRLFGGFGENACRGRFVIVKRIRDDLDRRLQSLDPILTIAAVHILFAVAEQIALNIPINGRATIWPEGVAQYGSHGVAMGIEGLLGADRLV